MPKDFGTGDGGMICIDCGEKFEFGDGKDFCEDCRSDFDNMDLEDRLEMLMRIK